jgi:TPR repeat protein
MKKISLTLIVALFATLLHGQTFEEVKKSAEQGEAKAQYNLGWMYSNGEGTLTDKKRAAYWIRLSYENGFEDAKITWDKYELYKY